MAASVFPGVAGVVIGTLEIAHWSGQPDHARLVEVLDDPEKIDMDELMGNCHFVSNSPATEIPPPPSPRG